MLALADKWIQLLQKLAHLLHHFIVNLLNLEDVSEADLHVGHVGFFLMVQFECGYGFIAKIGIDVA